MISGCPWKWFFISIQLFLLPACATKGDIQPIATGIVIDGVVIRNELALAVTDVTLLVPFSGNFVSCGNIMARSECSTTFPGRDYYANKIIVTWKEYGEPHSTGEFVISIPDAMDHSQPVRLEVIIFNRGQAGAQLVP